MNSNSYFQLRLRFMLDSEGIHGTENSQSHQCNLPGVVIPIPLWQSGHNHVCVTNCFYLQ